MCVSVVAPGTCGELIQGKIDGRDFLVSCPINCYSEIKIKKNNKKTFEVNVSNKEKLIMALKSANKALPVPYLGGYSVQLKSELIIGKGMASSTADMAISVIGAGILNDYRFSSEEIGRLLAEIEPSDGLFYEGIVSFNHRKGELLEALGEAFDVEFLVYDFGGEVDTIRFNNNPNLDMINIQKEKQIKIAYEILKQSFIKKDIKLLGKATTISALANQDILFKENLDEIIAIALSENAYGVNIAHSGTLVGIICDKNSNKEAIIKKIEEEYPKLIFLGKQKMVNGGVKSLVLKEDLDCKTQENTAVI